MRISPLSSRVSTKNWVFCRAVSAPSFDHIRSSRRARYRLPCVDCVEVGALSQVGRRAGVEEVGTDISRHVPQRKYC
jgi:hypothetical protein